jgi:hypothetical protein
MMHLNLKLLNQPRADHWAGNDRCVSDDDRVIECHPVPHDHAKRRILYIAQDSVRHASCTLEFEISLQNPLIFKEKSNKRQDAQLDLD